MKALNVVRQPEGSRVCGQACVATLLGISLDEAVKVVGKKGATNVKHLIPVLTGRYQIEETKLTKIKLSESWWNQVPDLGIVRVRWNKRDSHWVVKNGSRILDPLYGEGNIHDYHAAIRDIGGRFTSYLKLKNS